MTDTERLAALLHQWNMDYAGACHEGEGQGGCQSQAARLLAAGVTLAPTPAPLDVERLARAMERMSGVADPIDPGDCMAGVVTHREFAAAIAAAYAEEAES